MNRFLLLSNCMILNVHDDVSMISLGRASNKKCQSISARSIMMNALQINTKEIIDPN